MTKVSFTGTRDSMTVPQWKTLEDILLKIFSEPGNHEWHDGMCIGADAQAHDIVERLVNDNDFTVELHCHPASGVDKFQAVHLQYDVYHKSKPPLVRNKNMVMLTDVTIAGPLEQKEQIRSGTWSTIRFAYKMAQKLYIIWPDGEFTETRDE